MANKKEKFLTMKSQVRMISIKCYEEQLPYGWEETVKRIKKISKDKWIVIAIKHDKDSVTDEVWEPPLEKAHFHIIVKFVNGKLTAIKTGKTSIIIQLKDYPEIHKEIEVNIGSEPEFNAYINGDAVIKLDRQATYEFIANSNLTVSVLYSLYYES
mgnify:CR=1 FL=1